MLTLLLFVIVVVVVVVDAVAFHFIANFHRSFFFCFCNFALVVPLSVSRPCIENRTRKWELPAEEVRFLIMPAEEVRFL